jgi:hypothetical protein
MDETVRDIATSPPRSLIELPKLVADRLAPRFDAECRRPPVGRDEHPSASAIVIRCTDAGDIEYVSLGDCTLIVETDGTFAFVGVDEAEAGDRWVADALRGQALDDTTREAPLTRADLLPRLRKQRGFMNTPSGYGIFSITAPQVSAIRHGTLPIKDLSRILLASDGLMRLVDVFRLYDAKRLFAAAWANGLAPLFDELRAIENQDADCGHYPRAKVSDDATAVLLRVTELA